MIPASTPNKIWHPRMGLAVASPEWVLLLPLCIGLASLSQCFWASGAAPCGRGPARPWPGNGVVQESLGEVRQSPGGSGNGEVREVFGRGPGGTREGSRESPEGGPEGSPGRVQERVQKGVQEGVQEEVQEGVHERIQEGVHEGVQKGVQEVRERSGRGFC